MVSLNLCTDQLALLVARPGQILALSPLAADPMVSLMAEQARALPAHHGRAEEIYLLRPDLVLAGDYTNPETLRMLRRLGLRVETLPTANTLAEVRGLVGRMGTLLDSPDRAAQVLAGFDAALAALPGPGTGPVAVNYNPNGYTTGSLTFAGDVQRQAGLTLLTDRLGMDYGGNLPLEVLVMQQPALIIPGQRYATPSRSEEILTHPALRRLQADWHPVPDRDWICGLPQAATLAAELAAENRAGAVK
ncbi:ABC transporter substrate-binding protein [Paracoccus sp. DMF-8]|uniref:ABC transporter substrate-binding protein n=1 Tax=Paracoccus sp. DMF-8 TaxID=3019445 RepID=UPI0023E8332A|nr:ABC transporter substrate-binding protein [Paracoccus sp. DMF-8]MDF3606801.1 ABC transporter substrate-binding protein [Paracoccus sp. DMF-8]